MQHYPSKRKMPQGTSNQNQIQLIAVGHEQSRVVKSYDGGRDSRYIKHMKTYLHLQSRVHIELQEINITTVNIRIISTTTIPSSPQPIFPHPHWQVNYPATKCLLWTQLDHINRDNTRRMLNPSRSIYVYRMYALGPSAWARFIWSEAFLSKNTTKTSQMKFQTLGDEQMKMKTKSLTVAKLADLNLLTANKKHLKRSTSWMGE